MKKTPVLIITYNPAENLDRHLDTLYEQFNEIVLVDNGSSLETRNCIVEQARRRGPALKAILNDDNLGVATALNQGFSLAVELGYDRVITLDQDSVPEPGMKDALVNGFQNHSNREKLAVLAPVIFEEVTDQSARYLRQKNKFVFERLYCDQQFLRNVTFVITSGSLYNLNLYRVLGPFRDDFFIDAVDTEYCLRAIRSGYEVSVACGARLAHTLGNRQRKSILGQIHYPTFHSPTRWYYISRNRVSMLRMYAWRFPHWFFFEMAVTLTGFTRMLLFEDRRLNKIKAFLLGTRDGLRKKMGKISRETQKILESS